MISAVRWTGDRVGYQLAEELAREARRYAAVVERPPGPFYDDALARLTELRAQLRPCDG